MPNTSIANQTAALNTSDVAAVKVVTDTINASTMNTADKTAAHAALAARVKAINSR